MPSSEFKRRTVKGLRWGVIDQMSYMGLNQLTLIILMRILGPDEFGLIGMTNVFVNFATILIVFGIPAYIIQRKNLDEETLSTCYWLNIALGLFVTVVLVSIAPLIANFYREPRVTAIFIVLSLFFVVESFSFVQRALLNRDLNLKAMFKARLIGTLVSCVAAIYVALETVSVWALVLRIGLFKVVFTVMVTYYKRYIPRWTFRRNLLPEIAAFTIPLLGSSTIRHFVKNFDTLMVGRAFGSVDTGHYSRSYNIMQMPVTNISMAVNRVMMASFSKIQDERERIIDTYLKVNRMTAFITFPLMVFVFLMAPYIVRGVFGTDWLAMIPLLQVMSLGGVLLSVSALTHNIYIALGKTRYHLYNTLIGSALLVAGVLLGLPWGVFGVATGVAIALSLSYFPGIFFVQQIIGLSVRRNVLNFARVSGATLVFGLVVYVLDRLAFNWVTGTLIEADMSSLETSLYYLGHLVVMGLVALAVYWMSAKWFKINYFRELVTYFLSERIAKKFGLNGK